MKKEINFKEIANQYLEKLEFLDFLNYEEIIRKLKRNNFKNEKQFQEYKNYMIRSVLEGTSKLPKMKQNGNGEIKCEDGVIRLLTFKVLGLNPYVELAL